jgi:hypothetical protein
MSGGAVHTLLANDGRLDRIIFGNHILYARLVDIINTKMAHQAIYNGDVLPTYSDIEQTHQFFLNSTFRPIVQISFEYLKVNNASGQPQFGKPLEFDVQQAGEYWLDIMLHLVIEKITTAATGKNAGTVADVPLRWCDYPGERLLQRTEFTIAGNPLDEYYSNTYVFYRQFFLKADKLVGWKTCVGQEVPKNGYLSQTTSAAALVAPSTAPDAFRIGLPVSNGPQTFKVDTAYNNTAIEMMMPLMFWFCSDPRSAFPSICVPGNNRRIKITLETFARMAYVMPSFGGATNGVLIAPTISTAELYVNNLYIPDYLHVIVVRRVQFNVVRLHRTLTQQVNKNQESLSLQVQFKWPLEYSVAGVIPAVNVADSTLESMSQWHRYTTFDTTAGRGTVALPHISKLFSDVVTAGFTTLQSPTVVFPIETSTISTLGFDVQAVK